MASASNVDAGKPNSSGSVEEWHQDEAVLVTIGLDVLTNGGFVNLDDFDGIELDLDFQSSAGRTFLKNHYNSNDPIHPIFRKFNWPDISDADYQLIGPSLRLASRILDQPCITPFFKGLILKQKRWVKITPKPYHKQEMFYFTQSPCNEMDMLEVWNWFAEIGVAQCQEWRFRDVDPDTFACTGKTGGAGPRPRYVTCQPVHSPLWITYVGRILSALMLTLTQDERLVYRYLVQVPAGPPPRYPSIVTARGRAQR